MRTTIFETADIINDISEQTGIPTDQTKAVITSLKDLITNCIKQATADNNIIVRPFNSFEILAAVIPDRQRTLKGKEYTQTSRIKVKPRFTRYYIRNLINEL